MTSAFTNNLCKDLYGSVMLIVISSKGIVTNADQFGIFHPQNLRKLATTIVQ